MSKYDHHSYAIASRPRSMSPSDALRLVRDEEHWGEITTYDLMRAANYLADIATKAQLEIQRRFEKGLL